MEEGLLGKGGSSSGSGRWSLIAKCCGLVAVGALIGGLIGHFATPSGPSGGNPSIQPDNKAYDRTVAYQAPAAYAAELEFHLPYINLVEEVHAHVDTQQMAQRFEFYSGMDTFLINATGPSYEIVPVIDTLTCLQTSTTAEDAPPLQHVFPDLSVFSLDASSGSASVTTSAYPDGIDVDTWVFVTPAAVQDAAGNATSRLPVEGYTLPYAGSYKFHVSAADGTPVRFEFVGHNVVLGGSHYGEWRSEWRS